MPSALPRLNVVMTEEMRAWLEARRAPCESASNVLRRVLLEAMKRDP
jgi:hypothetical protein